MRTVEERAQDFVSIGEYSPTLKECYIAGAAEEHLLLTHWNNIEEDKDGFATDSACDEVRDSNGIIAKVRGIENWDDGYILNVQTVSGSICTLSATGALPIPLTPEILEKNGFVKESEIGYERFEWRENGSVAITLNRDSFSKSETFMLTTFKIGINGWLLKIEHVHQLQHAIRLAGIDKEIEL